MMNLEDVISAFVSIIEDIIQDRKARLGRNAHLMKMTVSWHVEYVWYDAAPMLTGTLGAYVKEDKRIEKMNKGHMITFNHPDTEAQDRNGLVERYIGL